LQRSLRNARGGGRQDFGVGFASLCVPGAVADRRAAATTALDAPRPPLAATAAAAAQL
jgi:hypothetical protein